MAKLAALANRVGNALRAQGVSRGDRVLIVLPIRSSLWPRFLAPQKSARWLWPVNPFARFSDYIHYLENSEPRAAIIHSNAPCGVFASIERAPANTDCHCRRGENRHARPVLREVESMGSGGQRTACGASTSPHDPAFMLYTSGSGGTPKAAVHRHADMLVTSRNYAQTVLGLRADDLTFSVSKAVFAYGLGNGCISRFRWARGRC